MGAAQATVAQKAGGWRVEVTGVLAGNAELGAGTHRVGGGSTGGGGAEGRWARQ